MQRETQLQQRPQQPQRQLLLSSMLRLESWPVHHPGQLRGDQHRKAQKTAPITTKLRGKQAKQQVEPLIGTSSSGAAVVGSSYTHLDCE